MKSAALLSCLLLAGCASGALPIATEQRAVLPPVPSDIQLCFSKLLPGLDRDYSVAEVETLWKQDRVRYVVMRRCGARFLSWYGDLKAGLK